MVEDCVLVRGVAPHWFGRFSCKLRPAEHWRNASGTRLDLDAKQTPAYASFHTYLIDKQGVLQAVLDGTKTERPASEAMLEEVRDLP